MLYRDFNENFGTLHLIEQYVYKSLQSRKMRVDNRLFRLVSIYAQTDKDRRLSSSSVTLVRSLT